MSSHSSNTLMTDGPIWKRIVAFAIPLFLGNLFQQLYNMADSLIVGNFLGSNALAAVSSSGNLIFLMVGFFNGMAVGAGVVIARYFGARDIEHLQDSIHTTIAFGLAAGILLGILGVLLAPQILLLMGTPAEVFPNSKIYFQIYFSGSLFFVMYNIFVGILQAVGDSKHPLYYLIISSVTNVILDYVYIFIMKWGMGGAALATATGTTLTVLILASHFFSKDNHLKLEFSDVWRRVPEVLGNGLASFILEISNGFVMLLFNRQLLAYVGEMGITVYGIITNTALVASSISNGIAQAVQPLLSANFGAGNLKRVGEARKLGVRTGFAAGFIFTAIGMLIPVQLSYLFLDPTPEILTMAVPAIRLYFLCFLVSEWNIISGMYFQSTVRPRFSLTITLLRGVILNSVFVFLLPALFGVDGIWLTVTVSEFITAGVAFVLMKREKH